MFIQQLFSEAGRQMYIFWVLSAVISITLHELAHGWTAIRHGDHTPIHSGHMTGNPLVHMGPFSLAALAFFGFAWGQMPIDPTRLRGRYAEAKVAAAGPGMNLLLALAAVTALGLWWRLGTPQPTDVQVNLAKFLLFFASANFLLCMFNLAPIPPLDGSHILANFHRGYAQIAHDPARQGVWIMAFMVLFVFVGRVVWGWAMQLAASAAALIAGSDLVVIFALS